jgi:hypothetical protein
VIFRQDSSMLGNFMKYFDKLDQGNQVEVSEKLMNYFNLLKNSFGFFSEKTDSLFLFREYSTNRIDISEG